MLFSSSFSASESAQATVSNDPLVSVVIPNYNHSVYLRRRIESVLAQTFQDFEIIFMDDASTDDSVSVARQWLPSDRTRFVLNEKNTRIPFRQWNTGMAVARGQFVWIAESDDFAAPTFLEKTVRVMRARASVGVVYAQSWMVDERDATLCSLLVHTDDLSVERWRSDFFNEGRSECQDYLCLRNTIPNASACLVRKSVYLEAGMAPVHLRQCGDWLHWINMLLHSDLYYLAEHLNYFRKHERSVRSSMEKSAEELVEVYQVLAFLAERVSLAPEKHERSCHITFQRWRALAGSFKPSASWLRNQLRVYRKARKFDGAIMRRITSLNFGFPATAVPV